MNIRVMGSTPSIWRQIHSSDHFTFQQFHSIVSKLFGWETKQDYKFLLNNRCIASTKQHQNQTIANVCAEHSILHYQYGSEELWKIEIEVEQGKSTKQPCLTLLDFSGNHPVYGLGGLEIYEKMLKELKNPNSIHFHSIHMILEASNSAFDALSIQSSFDQLVFQEDLETQFERSLHDCREAFEHAKLIAPNLVMITLQDRQIPCYVDQLDNGMELMFFPDESCLARSIMNSMHEDPDLLFTDAWTIDFLYEPCFDSELYVSEGKNLCFRYQPGCLAQTIQEEDMPFLITCLQAMIDIFTNHSIPTLASQRMGIYQDGSYRIEEFCVSEKQYALSLSKHDLHNVLTLPHTNEQISLYLVALPQLMEEDKKHLQIQLIAQARHDRKEMLIRLDSMGMIVDQLHSFLMELFQEHGIPEVFQINNINLAHLLSEVCKTLRIERVIGQPKPDFANATLEMILEALETPIQTNKKKKQEFAFTSCFHEDDVYRYPIQTKQKILN